MKAQLTGEMMKRILMVSYIVGVLLFSGFAKAEGTRLTELQISRVDYQEGSWNLRLSGQLKNQCVQSPQAILVPSEKGRNTFALKVMAKTVGEMCAQALRGPYTVSSDVRLLMRQLGVQIKPNQTYRVIAEGLAFEMTFEGSDALAEAGEQSVINGVLMSSATGQIHLMTEGRELIPVDDSQLDIRSYLNQTVSLVGQFGPLQPSDQRAENPQSQKEILPILPILGLLVMEIQPLTR